MKEPGEEQFKFRHVHAITGTFVLLVVGVLIAVFIFAGRSQRWFIGNVTLQITFPEAGAAGIRQGSEVYFLGTLVGTVADVSVDPSGRMQAMAKMRRDFFRFVRVDSSAVVKRKFGVMGDAFFEIARGHGEPLPEKNATIVCNGPLPSALETAIAEIQREALPTLKKLSAGLDTWTALGTNLDATQLRLRQLITRADEVAAGLQQGKGTAGKLLTDPAVADELNTLAKEANKAMDELRVTLKNLENASRSIEDGSRRFQVASTNFPAISDALAGEARDLPGLVLQTQISMRELERLIEALQKQWPWRKHVNPSNPPPLRSAPINQELERTAPPQQLPSPRKFDR
jgi:phospholipid/cholesterol/gamma-HCH transport system substrate-binding protein